MNDPWREMLDLDRRHLWHPYTSMTRPLPVYPVERAEGCSLFLADGTELTDGMASWWCAIHGYNHPVLNEAAEQQLKSMSHVMFGGITHEPAVRLGRRLVELSPHGLECVFFCDSGSVSVEVAMKMALQYQQATGQGGKTRFLSLRNGYHGDTFGAMSVCDPVTGMHQLFADVLPKQLFVERPACRFGEPCTDEHIAEMERAIRERRDQLAAVILEPIVQGAGGMWFYSPEYLQRVRALCDEHDVLLICDEIATGFGRTGKLFACEHADVSPDIMCVGKSLTGGMMTLAATLATRRVAEGISNDGGVFMHGPTFMANPLACAVADASIGLLVNSPWQDRIASIELQLGEQLAPCREMDTVKDVRVLGGIGVVETHRPVDVARMQAEFVRRGVWIRPFMNLVYVMPPYVISDEELMKLTAAIREVVAISNLFSGAT